MLAAYRLMADTMDKEGFNYPLHLQCDEAGDGDYGRVKSTAIATLLAMGWRHHPGVLNRAPEREIPVCYSILQSLVCARPWSVWAPRLRPNPVQSRGAAQGTERDVSSHGTGHRRHGLHCQRSGRDGGCGLRLCR